jgi:hypothetical protein
MSGVMIDVAGIFSKKYTPKRDWMGGLSWFMIL